MTTSLYNFLGRSFPFFLDNRSFSSYYIYQIISPGVSNDLTPYFSLHKISERTEKGEIYGNDNNILSVIAGKKLSDKECVKFVEDLMKKDDPIVEINKNGFPYIEIEETNNLQRVLITSLRDSIRWGRYKFADGKKIDILISPDEFLICNIKTNSNDDSIWLEPEAVYNIMDTNLTNPNKDLKNVQYPSEKFTGKNKISDLNRTIKKFEYNMFNGPQLYFNQD